MPVLALDHVNVRSVDPARTIAFFRDALQMRVGAPPGMTPSDKFAWIFDDNDLPVVHIASADADYPTDATRPFEARSGSGAIHHVALRCGDFDAMRDRLAALGLDFRANHVPQMSLRQIFVREPTDSLLELNFAGE